jgi:O-antigen ligase
VWIPAACVILLMALAMRPRIRHNETVRSVDTWLMLAGLAVVLQSVPLPLPVVQRIDPHAVDLRAALFIPVPPALSITILPHDTLGALAIFAAASLLFWIAREVCDAGGGGRIVRWIAAIGLLASIAGIVQRMQSPQLLYGYWRPLDAGARPYGPFVNRNHFATWAIMACPLIVGYLLARAPAGREGRRLSQRVATTARELGSIRAWLAASVCLLTVAVLVSTSRSGLIGLMGAFAISMSLSSGRQKSRTRGWMIAQAVLLAIVVLSFANTGALVNRFDEALAARSPIRGRTAIWQDAVRLVSDFRWTGTGVGTFGAAIVPYQTTEPGYTIGQAHNQYLQLAAEGGAMIVVPAALTLAAFLLLFRRRLMQDEGPDYLIRAGAGAGMAGVLVQSFWETGLRMPANAMLFAVLAAIAVHTPRDRAPRRSDS